MYSCIKKYREYDSYNPQIKFPIQRGIPIIMSKACPELSQLLNRGIKHHTFNNYYERKKYNHTYYTLMYTKYKPS